MESYARTRQTHSITDRKYERGETSRIRSNDERSRIATFDFDLIAVRTV